MIRIRTTMTAGAAFVGALALALSGASPAAAADAFQLGTRTSGPSSAASCVGDIDKARVCFDPNGDKIYVYDGDADSASAVADWQNWKHWNDNSVYRSGQCVNSEGAGTWVVCNKDFYEEGLVLLTARTYDRSAGKWTGSYGYESFYTS
ncbi:hypothetical protein AB8A21_20720 [Streptomyces sp. BF23-18]|uniref:hypothetical protein n=1 Tax=Streptomyces sp. BF23-18 TaxID=3240282 RepID=UPI0034E52E2B